MSFRLVPNSVTSDDLERRNNHIRIVISSNLVAFGADYVKVTPILSIYNGFYSARRLDLFVWCVRLSRFLVGFRVHLKSMHFHSFHVKQLTKLVRFVYFQL